MATNKSKDHTARVVDAIRARFKTSHVGRLSDARGLEYVLPTGLDPLDHWVLGCGGLPGGRVIEVLSDPDVGKSSLGYLFIAAAQRAGGLGILMETENTMMPERPPVFGVDLEQVILTEDASAEDLIGQTRTSLVAIPNDCGPNVLVWDSLAAASLQAQIDEINKSSMGKKAKLMSDEISIVARLARAKRCTIVIINQLRMKLGVLFGSSDTTPGGNAPKFQSFHRIQMWRGTAFKQGTVTTGHRVTIKAIKNKSSMPQRKASFKLDYRYGWDNEWSTIQLAKDLGILPDSTKQSAAALKLAVDGLRAHEGYGRPAED